jgi:hypothetical protein
MYITRRAPVHKPQKGASAPKCYAVCDGREALGVIAVAGATYAAITTTGVVIGTFKNMRQAMAAFGEAVS